MIYRSVPRDFTESCREAGGKLSVADDSSQVVCEFDDGTRILYFVMGDVVVFQRDDAVIDVNNPSLVVGDKEKIFVIGSRYVVEYKKGEGIKVSVIE